jgi:serine/threonine kinase PknH
VTTPPLAAGWYPDPTGRPGIVYWDGERWRTEIPAPPAGQPPGHLRGPKGLIAALVATIVILIAGIAGVGGYFLLQHHRASTASGATAPPLTEAALSGLLLAPDQLKTVTNTSGLTVTETLGTLPDISATVSDQACLPLFGLDTQTYGGSGWTAARIQALVGPVQQGQGRVLLNQGVVLFPSAQAASAFFTTSAQRWAACSNHQMKVSMPAGTPAVAATVGPVSNTNGTLSATMTQSFGGNTVNIERALTTVKNIVIDVFTISQAPLPAAPASVAHQIAAKIPTA